MKYLRLVEENLVGTAGISDVDISKIVVSVRGSGLTGEMLSRIFKGKNIIWKWKCAVPIT